MNFGFDDLEERLRQKRERAEARRFSGAALPMPQGEGKTECDHCYRHGTHDEDCPNAI